MFQNFFNLREDKYHREEFLTFWQMHFNRIKVDENIP